MDSKVWHQKFSLEIESLVNDILAWISYEVIQSET